MNLSKYQDRLSVKSNLTGNQIRAMVARKPMDFESLIEVRSNEEKCAELRRRIEAYKRYEFPASLDMGGLTLDEYVARLEVLLHDLESKR